MPAVPFIHPALIGLAVAGGVVWSAVAPRRLLGTWWTAGAGLLVALTAGICGWVPWIGELRLTAYAACLLAGFAVGVWIARRRSAPLGISADHLWTQTALAAVGGILGARLWYVLEYHREFPSILSDPSGWLTLAADLDRGGAVWFGGFLFATLLMIAHTRRSGIPVLTWADCLAPSVIAGLALGRLGCWFNGCCYGASCDLPWAVQHHGVLVHPTQLYELGACAILAMLVMRIPPGSGAASGWAMLSYAGWRFFNEMLRGDYDVRLGQGFDLWPPHLTSAQWFCLPLALFGGWLVLQARRKQT